MLRPNKCVFFIHKSFANVIFNNILQPELLTLFLLATVFFTSSVGTLLRFVACSHRQLSISGMA